MHGFQHKQMGVAAGVGVAAFMVIAQAPPELIMSAVAMPFGAMLPDIDHDNSKLGRARKKATTIIKVVASCGLLGLVVMSYFAGGVWNALLNAAYIGGAGLLVMLIERNKHVKKQLGFITKHRGIMHTLIPPALLIGSTFWTENVYFDYSIFGLAVGYVIHLLGDMATFEGAPILWPLTKSNPRYFAFKTRENGTAISVVCNMWCIIFIAVGIYFGVRGGL